MIKTGSFTISSAFFGVMVACVGDSPVVPTTTADSGPGVDSSTNNPDTSIPPADAAADSGCNGAPTTDFFVDALTGSDSNSGAGSVCALKTISAALIKSDKHYNATIHVAPGKYGPGETFPLTLDQGRSLLGADMSMTTIQGSSAPFNTMTTGSVLDEVDNDAGVATNHAFVTILAGDVIGGSNKLGATSISNVAVLPNSTVTKATAGYYGIACIAGNGPQTGSDPSKLSAANLVITNTTVGPNFATGLIIGSSPMNSSGCNVSVTTSTFKGNSNGIGTGACGTQNPSVAWPASKIGDGMIGNANTFSGNDIGIFGAGCGAVQFVAGNKFVSGYRGIVLVSNIAQYFEVTSNTFDGLTAPFMGVGLHMGSGAVVSKLNDNTFTNISSSPAAIQVAGVAGYAIIQGGYDILQALRNLIHDNDNGLWVQSSMRTTFSFSNGGNINDGSSIYCNSAGAGVGNDVILTTAQNNTMMDTFKGVHFDHAPPTTQGNANGIDLVMGSVNLVTNSTGTPANQKCAPGRVQ